MNKILALVALCVFGALAQPAVRFVNVYGAAESPITLNTNKPSMPTITLAYQQISDFITFADGMLNILSVTDKSGSQLTGTTLQLRFNGYATVAIVKTNTGLVPVFYNETIPTAQIPANSGLVRLINLSPAPQYLTINRDLGDIFSYIGYLEATPFVQLPVGTKLVAFDTQAASLAGNTYPVTGSIVAGKTHTIFFFDKTVGASVIADHAAPNVAPTGSASTSASVSTSTSGSTSSATGNTEIPEGNSAVTQIASAVFVACVALAAF